MRWPNGRTTVLKPESPADLRDLARNEDRTEQIPSRPEEVKPHKEAEYTRAVLHFHRKLSFTPTVGPYTGDDMSTKVIIFDAFALCAGQGSDGYA